MGRMTHLLSLSILEKINQLAVEAGSIIMQHRGQVQTTLKEDGSPVTKADQAADRYIAAGLHALMPDVPIISEEGNITLPKDAHRYFLVDPLDGTKGFIRGEDEFTVNIAYMVEHQPVAGVIYAPVFEDLYTGMLGHGAYLHHTNGTQRPLYGAALPTATTPPVLVTSRHHPSSRMQAFIEQVERAYNQPPRVEQVNASYKFCLLCDGRAHIYPRFGNTMEWDTAAGHALLRACGGDITQMDGSLFTYGKPNWLNGGFIATSFAMADGSLAL